MNYPTVEQTWEKYLALMKWAGFPNMTTEHRRQAERVERRIKNATPEQRQKLYDQFEHSAMSIMSQKMSANL